MKRFLAFIMIWSILLNNFILFAESKTEIITDNINVYGSSNIDSIYVEGDLSIPIDKNFPRISEVYSINNEIDDCMYKPKIEELVNLESYLKKTFGLASLLGSFFITI